MSIDVVSLRHIKENENAINVALPVFAVECEVRPPFEYQLDAYEEAGLRLVSVGLSSNGISKVLNITLSLAEQILSKLNGEKFIMKDRGHQWELTEDGAKYLTGVRENRPSDMGRFGYMFISAIKKDVLQFFYEGSIDKIARSDSEVVNHKLLLRDENSTFSYTDNPRRWRLEQAYKRYLRNLNLERKQEYDLLTKKEVQNAYSDYESLDESDYDEDDFSNAVDSHTKTEQTETINGHNWFVRPLKRPMEKLYLQMQIIISPHEPGGFTVNSPLDMSGIDDEFFLRQVQWMMNTEDVCYAGNSLNEFLNREVQKLSVHRPVGEKHKSVSILEELPQLAAEKDRYPQIYIDVGDIFDLMGINLSQIEKENIVGALNRKLLEALMNRLLRTIGHTTLLMVKKVALSAMNAEDIEPIIRNIAKTVRIERGMLTDGFYFKNSIQKLSGTLGNSIIEKLNNILTVYIYGASTEIKKFVEQPDFNDFIRMIIQLNKIRNPVSHDTNDTISIDDYEFYCQNVFKVANRLLESLKEAV